SIWKKEISLRKREAEQQPDPDPAAEAPVPADPDLDAAIAALAVPVESVPLQPDTVEPVSAPAPVPAVEHDWLTQPLEEVSEPPAELAATVSLVPELVEPVAVEPVVIEPVAVEPQLVEPQPIEPVTL